MIVTALAGLSVAMPAGAEPGPDSGLDARSTRQPPQAAAAQPGSAGFLFGRPSAALGIRWQWVEARAESEIFDFVGDLLTLDRDDFDAHGLVVDVGVSLASRLDVVAGIDVSRTTTSSNYRDFVDQDGLEIEQVTRLTQFGLTGGLELALLPRGRAIGQYAWIPSTVTPYVGAGAALIWYRFEQEGDFVDFVDQSIFTARLQSSGWTLGTHVSAGVDVRLTNRVQLTVEGRQQWADAGMSADFVDFDDIDLTGLRITAGVQFTF